MEEEPLHPVSDLDLSFSSAASDRTFASSSSSSSGRASLTRSTVTLSFTDRLSSTPDSTTTTTTIHRHHTSDPHWSSINAATAVSSDGRLHLCHLKLIRHIGSGNLGTVFLCHLRVSTSSRFALKVIDRDSFSAKKLCQVQTESEVLSQIDHPFLPTLYARIDASRYTCLLIDYCPGGDLQSLLHKQPGNRFPVKPVRFFAAEVLVALEYLHALGIVYRDLKPENVLIREDGHIMLSDFDLCFTTDVVPNFRQHQRRSHIQSNCFMVSRRSEMVAEFTAEPVTALSRSCVGTHEYLAPEIVAGDGYGGGVDWWALGVFIYELLYGTTPFKGDSEQSTLRKIASSEGVRFSHVAAREESRMMRDARDLIEKLLVKDERKRLGCARGAQDIKRHSFFGGIKWPLIRHYRPPEISGLPTKIRSHVGHVPKRPRWNLLGEYCNKMKNSRNRNNFSNNNCYWYNTKK